MKSFIEKTQACKKTTLDGLRLPSFEIDDKYYNKLKIKDKITNDKFLRLLCENGLKSRGLLGKENLQVYRDRLDRELSLFEDLGYVDYFLLIWDIVNFAREKDIAVGIGRGSGVSSLTLYCLGITGVDPIKYNLIFERFVSRARAKSKIIDGVRYFEGDLPDVDIDFCYVRRPEVLNYIKDRFKGKTCKVLTVGTLQGKLVVKECCKIAGGYDDASSTLVSSKITKEHGAVQHISEAVKDGLEEWVREPRKKYQYKSNLEVAKIAEKIEGLPKNFGVHASAMGVSYYDLDGYCPVQLTKDGELVSGYTKKDIEEMLVKVDVLGLKTMTVLDRLMKSTGIKLEEIDIDDFGVFEAISSWNGYNYGLFQLEGYAASGAMRKVIPSSINDLSAINALARPGGMAFINGYSKRKNDGDEIPKLHPELDMVTEDTFGYIIYQEQIMRAFHDVFGFTLEEAETIRRIIGKKLTEKIKEWKPKIIEAGKEKGVSEEVTNDFWEAVDASSSYSFNKCLCPDTIIKTSVGEKRMKDIAVGEKVLAYDTKNDKDHYVEVIGRYENFTELFEVEMENGIKIKCSMNHKFLCEDGEMHKLSEIIEKDLGVANGKV
jgi:DNA polymerase-3 subunit alpha